MLVLRDGVLHAWALGGDVGRGVMAEGGLKDGARGMCSDFLRRSTHWHILTSMISHAVAIMVSALI